MTYKLSVTAHFNGKCNLIQIPTNKHKKYIFRKNQSNENSLPVTFNNAKVVTCSTHKHLGILLDKPLSFNEHIQSKMNKY